MLLEATTQFGSTRTGSVLLGCSIIRSWKTEAATPCHLLLATKLLLPSAVRKDVASMGIKYATTTTLAGNGCKKDTVILEAFTGANTVGSVALRF